MITQTYLYLLDGIPPTHRLALAYAPASSRAQWLALFALDARLAGVVRAAREPVLGQLRLAWWRERLVDQSLPRGEPLLSLLQGWGEHRSALVALVDGWEAMLGEAPLGESALSALAEGRAGAVAALARACGAGDDAKEAGRLALGWALGDLATHVSHSDERSAALALLEAQPWKPVRLARSLRPLVVLHGLGIRHSAGAQPSGIGALLSAIRLGIFGR